MLFFRALDIELSSVVYFPFFSSGLISGFNLTRGGSLMLLSRTEKSGLTLGFSNYSNK